MYSVLLRYQGKPVCAALFRCFGQQLAELPLIATRWAARRTPCRLWPALRVHTLCCCHLGQLACCAVLRRSTQLHPAAQLLCSSHTSSPQQQSLDRGDVSVLCRHTARRQGHARVLVGGIEGLLRSKGVQWLVLPAAHETVQTWRFGFGYRHLDAQQLEVVKSEVRACVTVCMCPCVTV